MPLASFVLFAAALAFPSAPAAAGGSDPQAVQILQSALEAHGGRSAVEALREAVLTGRSRLFRGERTVESPLRIEIRNWDQLRVVTEGGGESREFVSDGRFASSRSDGGRSAFAEGRSANRIAPFNPVAGLLRAFLQDRVRLRLLGRERPAEGEALRLALDLVDSDPRRIEEGRARDRTYQALIDAETLLVRELLLISRDWDRDQPELWERWTCSDCRKAGDTLAPCRIEMRRCGRLHLEIALDSVRSQTPAGGELKP